MTNKKQVEKYVIFPRIIENKALTLPLIFDDKINYDIILKTFENDVNAEIFKKYENVNEDQYNLVLHFSILDEEEKDKKIKGLIKKMDKLRGEQ